MFIVQGCYLGRTRQLGALSDALLYVAALLIGDGGMFSWALIRHEDPEHIPKHAKASCTPQVEKELSLPTKHATNLDLSWRCTQIEVGSLIFAERLRE